jgi:DNA-binding XRE family transcriptional regulator
MNAIKIVDQTDDTVTVRREDWLELLAALENAEDRAAVGERRTKERSLGKEVARANYLTADEAARLLEGENPIKLWREKRGLSQRALAEDARIAASYLAEIESGRKPGSDNAVRKLASALRVAIDDLDPRRGRIGGSDSGPVVIRLSQVSPGMPADGRGPWAPHMPQPTLRGALKLIRDEWKTMRSRSPYIVDENGTVIYTTEELLREMEG